MDSLTYEELVEEVRSTVSHALSRAYAKGYTDGAEWGKAHPELGAESKPGPAQPATTQHSGGES